MPEAKMRPDSLAGDTASGAPPSAATKVHLRAWMAVGGIGFLALVNVGRGNGERVAVQSARATRRDLVAQVLAAGHLRARAQVDIAANVSGRIVELPVRAGGLVEPGRLLVRIDSARYEAEARQSAAAVASAQADLGRAQAERAAARLAFERARQLHQQALLPDQAFEAAQTELDVKRANVESGASRLIQLQAAHASTTDNLAKTVVLAPMAGTVVRVHREIGEVVIGAQSFAPTLIMTLADLSGMQAEVYVDEADYGRLRVGQKAGVRVKAFETLDLGGTVTEIASVAAPRESASQGGGRDFRVVVTLEHAPDVLRPGLNASVSIVTAERPRALAVPLQAVVVRELTDAGQAKARRAESASEGSAARAREREGVFVITGGVAHFRPVRTGEVGETDIEVLDGLSEGDEIVVGTYKTLRTLRDADHVRAQPAGD